MKNASASSILVVEDDARVRDAICRSLATHVAFVEATADLAAARAALGRRSFDLVLTDLQLPDGTGIELVRALRAARDATAVVILTGAPDLESAIEAVHLGAVRYLRKPVSTAELRQVVGEALARAGDTRALPPSAKSPVGEWAGRPPPVEAAQLDRALAGVHVAWQPIVDLATCRPVAFEALVRCEDAALPPLKLFALAARLGRREELTLRIRDCVLRGMVGTRSHVFLNVRADELNESVMLAEGGPLEQHARRLTLELNERSALEELVELREPVEGLRRRGFRIALDDLGAGSAGVGTFVHVTPDIAKIDRSMVTALDQEPLKRHIFGATVRVCGELGIPVVAEGIETHAELALVREAGCPFGQGYLLGRPSTRSLAELEVVAPG